MRGCVNCWVRRVSFVNTNRALEIEDSAAVSVYQVTLKGNDTHFFMRNLKNYGAWFGLVEDLAGQQHGQNAMVNTTGTVFWRSDQATNVPIDLHAGQPYANLIDCTNRGRLNGAGGHTSKLPHHLRHAVFWNFQHDPNGTSSKHYALWPSNPAMVKPIIVGLHGDPATFGGGRYEVLESNGSEVSPGCLFEAQLETRLGSVPAWLDDLRTEWATLKATSLPVPTVLAKSTIDDVVLAEVGNTEVVSVANKFEVLHNRSISSYSVSSSNAAVATATRSGTNVTVTAAADGSATITVTATSSAGDTADWKFDVRVGTSRRAPQALSPASIGANKRVTLSTAADNGQGIALSDDASLRALRLSGINFGVFSSAMTDYAAAVGYDMVTTEVVAAPADAGASVVIEDANGDSAGRRRTVALIEGENTISITVTAEDGQAAQTYRVIVVRGPDEWIRDARSFALDWNNTSPAGLWSDRDTLWVADWRERKLFAYSLPDGDRLLGRDIAVEGAPMGLWSDGEIIWVVNHRRGLQAYRLADGVRVPGRDLELADSSAPAGLWSDGTTVWVSEWLGRTVKAYLLADGRRIPSRDIVVDDAAETLLASGIWADGLTLWLADWSVDRVRALSMSDGGLEAGRSVATAERNYVDPTGLWSDGSTLWVSSWNGKRVHVHPLPQAQTVGALRENEGEPAFSDQTESDQAEAIIADAILRDRILAALGKAAGQPLGVADMASLTALNLRHAGVADLSGLEHAAHLEQLDLGFNPVADLSALAELPALSSLNLDGVSLADLALLSSLTGLESLSLRNNDIVELAPLVELSRLTRLDLGGNEIASLHPLSGLTELTELWADGNRINDISALESLSRLTQLDLSGNRIRHLHALSSLQQLETLKLSGNELSQLYPLSSLSELRTLVLGDNEIEELQPLSDLGKLRSLDVHGNRVTGLHPLLELRSLVWLDICDNPIKDFFLAAGLSAEIILDNAEHQGISD